MSKIKTQIKKLVVYGSVFFAVACILNLCLFYTIKASLQFADKMFPAYVVAEVNVPSKKPLTMQEWVMREVAAAGLDTNVVACLIKNESNWANDCNANKNLSTDCGVWRINSVHKKTISFQDRLDYKKATEWSINKIKKDGYGAWVAYSKCAHLSRK